MFCHKQRCILPNKAFFLLSQPAVADICNLRGTNKLRTMSDIKKYYFFTKIASSAKMQMVFPGACNILCAVKFFVLI